jgi:Zn-dependent peptidase ImmA (M78 family)
VKGEKNSLLPHGFKANAERQAVEFRKKLDLTAKDPLCGFDLAKHLEIPTYSPFEIGLSTSDASKLMRNGSGWSGLTMKNCDDDFLIIYNSRHSSTRQQSTIMHELAHIICKHELPQPTIIAGIPLPFRTYDPQIEAEAEWLGANLQITREGLLHSLKKGKNIEEIAEHFNASPSMVTYRINITGVRNQLKYLQKYV